MTKRKHLKRRARQRSAKTGESYTSALRHLRAHTKENTLTTAETTDEIALACSFCNKSTKVVKKLIAGPGVYICDECLALCNDILAEDATETPSEPAPSLDDAPVERLLSILEGMASTVRMMEGNLARWARRLHARGASEEAIATAAGLSREEAVLRFGL